MLKVSDLHEVHYEERGKQDGNPVIFIHGGPGGGCQPECAKYFDPAVYRIILLDQRGSGKSTPHAELKENTTWHLVEDIEKLRKHLKIDKWVVFGGSWGSTLSLTYAIKYPDVVKALILRGIFLLRRFELLWFYQEGASNLYPDVWEDYIAPIPPVERGDLMSAYYRRLTGDDEEEMVRCAQAWTKWEMSTAKLYHDPSVVKSRLEAENGKWPVAFARIECHYFVHGGWFESDGWILDNVDKIRHIPTTIVHGRYDLVCPPRNAWELKKALPDAQFCFVDGAGHSATEPGSQKRLIQATEEYKHL